MKDEEILTEDLITKLKEQRWPDRLNPAAIFSVPPDVKCLDTAQLAQLENAFRQWANKAQRADIRVSRTRIVLIFLLLRYTGARLNEILSLNDQKQIDLANTLVRLGKTEKSSAGSERQVPIPATLAEELKEVINDPTFAGSLGSLFKIDPGHVRRKFYERAQTCGFHPELGNPNAIRRSRAIELLRSNLPLQMVQKLLGQSTPSLTASYVDFSAEEMRQVTRHFIEKESHGRTSARNTFFGKITRIQKGDIQAVVELLTLEGDTIMTVITNDSLKRLGIRPNSFVTAEVKAPWLFIAKEDADSKTSADNRLQGVVSRIVRGDVATEYEVRTQDGTELCIVTTAESNSDFVIRENDMVWVLFNAFAVVLHID